MKLTSLLGIIMVPFVLEKICADMEEGLDGSCFTILDTVLVVTKNWLTIERDSINKEKPKR